jgi:hypothetical protein
MMAFDVLDVINIDVKSSDGTGISASLVKMTSAKAKLRISFSKEAMRDIGFVSYNRLKVMIGTGEHAGVIRLALDEKGAAVFQERKHIGGHVRYIVALGHCPQVADVAAKSTSCLWKKINDATIEINLPAWSRKVQTLQVSTNSETELQRQNREAQERRTRLGMG